MNNEISYEKHNDTNRYYSKDDWNVAFGLQKVDRLTPSKYMISLAEENISKNKDYLEVKNDINKYYNSNKNANMKELEADLVSLHIVELLNDKSFTFNITTLKNIHKKLFSGVDINIPLKYIGEFRDYNISKSEHILNGDTVIYADYTMIRDSLIYDFEEEEKQKYINMSESEIVERLAKFTSSIWQVHGFAEGNTRTTAIFIEKYLISKGFNINNELFKDNSEYFRNALVRANYNNYAKKIESDNKYLIIFFENLLFNKNNKLDNNDLYISN